MRLSPIHFQADLHLIIVLRRRENGLNIEAPFGLIGKLYRLRVVLNEQEMSEVWFGLWEFKVFCPRSVSTSRQL